MSDRDDRGWQPPGWDLPPAEPPGGGPVQPEYPGPSPAGFVFLAGVALVFGSRLTGSTAMGYLGVAALGVGVVMWLARRGRDRSLGPRDPSTDPAAGGGGYLGRLVRRSWYLAEDPDEPRPPAMVAAWAGLLLAALGGFLLLMASR